MKVRHPAEMDLGDMYISLAYVDRQIALDREDAAAAEVASVGESAGEEWPLPKDRGVSGAMADVFDLQVRGPQARDVCCRSVACSCLGTSDVVPDQSQKVCA